jgi:pentatricopeptide repeat domain-containing protein 1
MLLSKMRAAGVVPTAKAYVSAIFACKAAGQWEPALDLLKQMRADGYVLSTVPAPFLLLQSV